MDKPIPPLKPFNVNLEAFRSDRVVVTIKTTSTKRKVIQIMFGRDNSLYVNFPYFRHREGLLAHATMHANRPATQDVDLKEGGKVSSHLVKYSHHPDGRAHFSQDGKVRTEIKRQSLALDRQEGHMFTVMVQGLTAFDDADAINPDPTPKRTTITFDVPNTPEPTAFKIVGRWYDIARLQYGGVLQPTVGPAITVQDATGKQQIACILANPRDTTRHVLLVTCEPIPPLGPTPELLMFVGGFDSKDVVNNLAVEAGFLAFLYPAEDTETLRQTLGSVDYRPADPAVVNGDLLPPKRP